MDTFQDITTEWNDVGSKVEVGSYIKYRCNDGLRKEGKN